MISNPIKNTMLFCRLLLLFLLISSVKGENDSSYTDVFGLLIRNDALKQIGNAINGKDDKQRVQKDTEETVTSLKLGKVYRKVGVLPGKVLTYKSESEFHDGLKKAGISGLYAMLTVNYQRVFEVAVSPAVTGDSLSGIDSANGPKRSYRIEAVDVSGDIVAVDSLAERRGVDSVLSFQIQDRCKGYYIESANVGLKKLIIYESNNSWPANYVLIGKVEMERWFSNLINKVNESRNGQKRKTVLRHAAMAGAGGLIASSIPLVSLLITGQTGDPMSLSMAAILIAVVTPTSFGVGALVGYMKLPVDSAVVQPNPDQLEKNTLLRKKL